MIGAKQNEKVCGSRKNNSNIKGTIVFACLLEMVIVVEAYAPKEAFYIGFDCGHCCDGIDTKLAYDLGLIDEATKEMLEQSFSYLSYYPVRDVDYVIEQCKKIVDQLEELEK